MIYNRNIRFSSIISITYSILILSIFFAGCESPKEKREREAEEKREAIQTRRESATRTRLTEEAKSDYSHTLHAYQGVAGNYSGSYTLPVEGRPNTVVIQLRATVAGAASPSHLDLADNESEVRSFRDALNLNVELTEFNNTSRNRVVVCQLPGVKPDFGSGRLQLTCSGSHGSSVRVYEILFERSEAYSHTSASTMMGPMSLDELTTLRNRASEISSSLIAGRLNTVDALNVRIEAPALVSRGQLIRVQGNNR